MSVIKSNPLLLAFILIQFIVFSCKQNNKQVEENQVSVVVDKKIKLSNQTIQNRKYPTFELKNKSWIAQNMAVETAESWCYNKAEHCDKSGRLYRWSSAVAACKSLGPGWRMASLQDWEELAQYHGGYYKYLDDKEIADSKQANAAFIAGGNSNLNHILAGWRGSGGGFESIDKTGYYWTSTARDDIDAWCMVLYPYGGRLTFRPADKELAFSCRCVKEIDGGVK